MIVMLFVTKRFNYCFEISQMISDQLNVRDILFSSCRSVCHQEQLLIHMFYHSIQFFFFICIISGMFNSYHYTMPSPVQDKQILIRYQQQPSLSPKDSLYQCLQTIKIDLLLQRLLLSKSLYHRENRRIPRRQLLTYNMHL